MYKYKLNAWVMEEFFKWDQINPLLMTDLY